MVQDLRDTVRPVIDTEPVEVGRSNLIRRPQVVPASTFAYRYQAVWALAPVGGEFHYGLIREGLR